MKVFAFLIISLFCVSIANATDIALLNTSVLGKNISDQISVLAPHGQQAIKPSLVQIQTENDSIRTVSLAYTKQASFGAIKELLAKSYGKHKSVSQGGVDNDFQMYEYDQFVISFSATDDVFVLEYSDKSTLTKH